MAEQTRQDAMPDGTVEAKESAPEAAHRSVVGKVSEAGLALLYLLAFAAVGLCGGDEQASVAAVGAVGMLVAIGVCVVAALRGQLLTSALLMAVLMGLAVISNPLGASASVEQPVGEYHDSHYEGFIDIPGEQSFGR